MGFNIFFVGPSKTGSTSLFHLLRERLPGECFPNGKDTFFFTHHKAGEKSKKEYMKLFMATQTIDISHDICLREENLCKLKKEFPEAIIIYGERDPLERAVSSVSDMKRNGLIKGSVERFLTVESSQRSDFLAEVVFSIDPKKILLKYFDEKKIIKFSVGSQSRILTDLKKMLPEIDLQDRMDKEYFENQTLAYRLKAVARLSTFISRLLLRCQFFVAHRALKNFYRKYIFNLNVKKRGGRKIISSSEVSFLKEYLHDRLGV